MKKNYIKPISEVYHVNITPICTGSNVNSIQLTNTTSNTDEDALVHEEYPTNTSIWEEEW